MKKTHKLLAVMIWFGSAQANAEVPRTLATGAPACGNTVGKTEMAGCSEVRRVRWAERTLTTAKGELASARAQEVAYVETFLTTPRRLANGAPACGNVMSKDDGPTCNEELADLQHARRLDDVTQAFARTATARAQVHEATRTVATARLALIETAPPTEVARR